MYCQKIKKGVDKLARVACQQCQISSVEELEDIRQVVAKAVIYMST